MPTITSVSRFIPAPIPLEFALSHRKRTPAFHYTCPLKPRLFSVLAASFHDHNSSSSGINSENLLCSGLYVSSNDPPLISSSSLQFSNSVSDSNLRVAYQGVPGAYSEEAAEEAYPNCQPVPCAQFDSAFEAVEKDFVDRAVLPIENSIVGSIHRNYDLLFRHGLYIVGEVNLPISHCLLANPDVKIEDLKRVISHPQHVADHKLNNTGAIASSRAAALYGLNILARDIQDKRKNITREPIIAGLEKPFMTSIVFSLKEGPGVLFKALAVFAFREITLSKIESRPLNGEYIPGSDDGKYSSCFHYLFHVDFQASMTDKRAQFALKGLEEFSTYLRVLGGYPMDTAKREIILGD